MSILIPAMPPETTTQVEATQTPPVETPPQEKREVTFGDGRYSKVMKELFGDSKRLLGLDDQQAEKLARSYGAELGRYNARAEIKYGKVNKDGKMTLRESCTIKGVTVTYSIALAKTCVLLQETFAYGVKTHKVTLDANFIEWLNKV